MPRPDKKRTKIQDDKIKIEEIPEKNEEKNKTEEEDDEEMDMEDQQDIEREDVEAEDENEDSEDNDEEDLEEEPESSFIDYKEWNDIIDQRRIMPDDAMGTDEEIDDVAEDSEPYDEKDEIQKTVTIRDEDTYNTIGTIALLYLICTGDKISRDSINDANLHRLKKPALTTTLKSAIIQKFKLNNLRVPVIEDLTIVVNAIQNITGLHVKTNKPVMMTFNSKDLRPPKENELGAEELILHTNIKYQEMKLKDKTADTEFGDKEELLRFYEHYTEAISTMMRANLPSTINKALDSRRDFLKINKNK